MKSKQTKTQSESQRHVRTRKDHATETAEDYVEAVAEVIDSRGSCRVVDLARHFGVSHVTVTRIISRLQNEGLLDTQPYRPIELTKRGEELAAQSRSRHQTVFQFLLAIGVDRQTAAIDAEGIEHHVSPLTLEKMQEVLESKSKT